MHLDQALRFRRISIILRVHTFISCVSTEKIFLKHNGPTPNAIALFLN